MISSTSLFTHLFCVIGARPFHLEHPGVFSVGRVEEGSALVCIGRIEWGMAPRCGTLYGVNGIAVPAGITFRPFSTKFDGYSFGVNWSGHPVEGPTVRNSSDCTHRPQMSVMATFQHFANLDVIVCHRRQFATIRRSFATCGSTYCWKGTAFHSVPHAR
jgi:hypothetical protein